MTIIILMSRGAGVGAVPSQLADIANEVWPVVHKQRSDWSFLTKLRPFTERW